MKPGIRVKLIRFLGPVILHIIPRLKNTNRSVSRKINLLVGRFFVKIFNKDTVGIECFEREIMAHQIFKQHKWMPPLLFRGTYWLIRPFYAPETRLDRVAETLNYESRFEVARQAIRILFDFLQAGYAHCDFHAENLFFVNGQLLLTDFETMQSYPVNCLPPFPLSYDVIGEGLPSPFMTGNMSFIKVHPRRVGLQQLLEVPLEDLLDELRGELKYELHAASQTFKSKQKRHRCRAEKIYGSFSLPFFTVDPEIAQRNSKRRLERMGIDENILFGNSVLDLGSNIGAMLFETQRYKPGRCLGVEFDSDKVAVARKIAQYNGLNNLKFMIADIEKLRTEDIQGPFDVVFCLAVEAHVQDKKRLYQFLGNVTARFLFFEGNSTTDPDEVQRCLLRNGFKEIQYLGMCDDDSVPENNNRPLLVAKK